MARMVLLYILSCLLLILESEASAPPLTIVQNAVAKGAVCLDGSPPAYQFEKGYGWGDGDWLIHLEAGAWCESKESCVGRQKSKFGLGSSKYMSPLNFTGILSNQNSLNPNFYTWNKVIVRYCDGSSFTGDVAYVDPATNLHFRGARIFNVIIEELLAKGMNRASNVILSGCSSGGLAAIFHCDEIRALFPKTTRVKCIADAGYFPYVKDVSGGYNFEKYFTKIVNLHESEKHLPKPCTSNNINAARCFYPQFALPHVKTPVFILNSIYDIWAVQNIWAPKVADPKGAWSDCRKYPQKCSTSQNNELQHYRHQFLNIFSEKGKSRYQRGFFLNSCFTHCQSLDPLKWLEDPATRLSNKSISEAFGEWYYDKRGFQHIDHQLVLPHVCGGTGPWQQ